MRMAVVPIDFKESPEGLRPVDAHLYALTVKYCKTALAEQPTLEQLRKTWVIVEYQDGVISGVTGIFAYGGNVPDIPIFRVTGPNAKRATKMAQERLNAFFADQGMRGRSVFLYISESEAPEQRCEAWDQSLKDVGAVSAQRFAITVR